MTMAIPRQEVGGGRSIASGEVLPNLLTINNAMLLRICWSTSADKTKAGTEP